MKKKTQKKRKMQFFEQKSQFWPTWSQDRALSHESKKMRKVHFWGDWVTSDSQNSQPFSQNLGFSVIFWFFAKKGCKNFSHKKLEKSKNVCPGELYIFCFMNFFVSPSTRMWHPKNSDFWPFLQISRFFAIKVHKNCLHRKFIHTKTIPWDWTDIFCVINFFVPVTVSGWQLLANGTKNSPNLTKIAILTHLESR